MYAVRASPPDLLKIVKTDDVTRNAGQQPECPGYGRRERRRARFFSMRPLFFCPSCDWQGWTAARHVRGHGAAVAGRMARCGGHCASAGKRKTAAMHGTGHGRSQPAAAAAMRGDGMASMHAMAKTPELDREPAGVWPEALAGEEGRGGRAGRGPWAGGRPPTRQEAACKDAQAQRGARGHAKGPHAVTGIAGRVVEGQRGIGSIGRSGTLRGRAVPDGARKRRRARGPPQGPREAGCGASVPGRACL